jgi:hypothetical protein
MKNIKDIQKYYKCKIHNINTVSRDKLYIQETNNSFALFYTVRGIIYAVFYYSKKRSFGFVVKDKYSIYPRNRFHIRINS